jgi:hypothetical protein
VFGILQHPVGRHIGVGCDGVEVTLTLSISNWALPDDVLPVMSIRVLAEDAVTVHVWVVKVWLLALSVWFEPPKLKLPVTLPFWRLATSMLMV